MTTEPKPHNPDNLTPDQVGAQDGWRLLCIDELESYFQDFPCLDSLEAWTNTPAGWIAGCLGDSENRTYRTKLTREELRKARGLIL